MSPRTRLLVVSISVPIIVFAIVGGFLGRVMAREDTYQHLRIFDDVVNLITNNYVEDVNVDKVMHGAMHGLADGLDPDSAFLTIEQVKAVEAGRPLPPADTGIELTRQYYLRVVSVREGSPAAKAGLRSGDYVRAIGDEPTREMSVWEGTRALRGAAGSTVKLTVIRGSATDPHVVELTREPVPARAVTSRIAAPGVGYLRVPTIGARTAAEVKTQVADLVKAGAQKLVVDVRQSAGDDINQGVALARLFVPKGTLAVKESKSGKDTIAAGAGDGGITLPTLVLVDIGTSGPAEVFAAALSGNQRAELVGERTLGRAAVQQLVKLPDGSGLWLSTTRYLSPAGVALSEKGLEPVVTVEQPEVEFGQPGPTTDAALEKALERFASHS